MSTTDRPFLDANILFSAAHKDDSIMLRFWRWPVAALLTSDDAVEEAARNLPPARRIVLWRLPDRLSIFATPPAEDWRIPDAVDLAGKDRPILAAAIAAGATHLITGDPAHFHHLFRRTIAGVLILPPSGYRLDAADADAHSA